MSRLPELTQEQKSWLLKAETGRSYSFQNDVVAWREVGRPLKAMGLIRWVTNPRITTVVLTSSGTAVRDNLRTLSQGGKK